MSTIELVDPELRAALAEPLPPLTAETLRQRRAKALELAAAVPKPHLPDIATDEIQVESAFGAKPIRVLTYRPVTSDAPLPAIVHIHGGGFVMGAPEMKDVENRLFASELRCAIYSVDHRLAPESPHPAPVEDIYSVFVWPHANAGQLGLDPARIGIKGESGGGCRTVRARPAGTSLHQIFGSPDDMKFQSSMTLFASAVGDPASAYYKALDKWCNGTLDPRTLKLLE